MKLFQGQRMAAAIFALLSTTPFAAEVTELWINGRDNSGNRFVKAADGLTYALRASGGYHIITHCGLTNRDARGPRHQWDQAPLGTWNDFKARGFIEGEDHCHQLMGHQKPNPGLAGKLLRGTSGDYLWYIDSQGHKHSFHSRTPVWNDCGVANLKAQVTPFDTIMRITGGSVITDVNSCIRVAGRKK